MISKSILVKQRGLKKCVRENLSWDDFYAAFYVFSMAF